MNKDYLAMTYAKAEKKLRRAMQMCMDQDCSAAFRARLHRDIGIIYVVGLNRLEDGKDEFATALTLDSTVAISQEMNNEEAEKAFLEVKYTLFPETQPVAPASAAAPLATPQGPAGPNSGAKDSEADGAAWRKIANWVSLAIQQDFLVHSKTNYVCNRTRYRCWDAYNVPQDYTDNTVPQGNQIPSTTVKAATFRVLLGYERLLLKNVSVGLKFGMVLGGKAPRVLGDPAVVSIHGEAKGSYYFGQAPFEPTNIVRPYVFAAGGIAEVSSKVAVDIFEVKADGRTEYSKVLAWKRAGKLFIGAGVGSTFALAKNHGPFIEARFVRMMEKPSFAAAIQAGYTYGF